MNVMPGKILIFIQLGRNTYKNKNYANINIPCVLVKKVIMQKCVQQDLQTVAYEVTTFKNNF